MDCGPGPPRGSRGLWCLSTFGSDWCFCPSKDALMEISLQDVHQALTELSLLCYGELGVEDAIREIVQTTHTVFAVDGAGLMFTDDDQRLRAVAASDDRFAHLEELQ